MKNVKNKINKMCQEVYSSISRTSDAVNYVLYVGSFEQTSNQMIVSDPCYERGLKYTATADVQPGTWHAFVVRRDCGGFGIRNAVLFVVHEDSMDEQKDPYTYNCLLHNDIGVDSGQAGMYDAEFYRNDRVITNLHKYWRGNDLEILCEDEPWYSANCGITLQQPRAGVVPHGCVSSSGFGDGGYCLYGEKNDEGEYTHLSIVFLWVVDEPEEADDEDNYEDEMECDEYDV